MRPKLCLGCSLLVHGFTYLLLAEILLSFLDIQQLHVTKKHRLCDKNHWLASCLRHHASLISCPLHADAYPWQS